MTTVKQLLREIEELKMREHVWLGIRDYLEGFTPEGDIAVSGSEAVINEVKVPQDIIIDVLGDIDSECLGPIQSRIRAIEASKVGDGKAKESSSKTSRKRTTKKSRNAGAEVDKS